VLSRLRLSIGVSALSDQLAAVAVTMGERLGSDDARRSTLPNRRGLQLLEPCGGDRAHHPILCFLGHVMWST